MKRIWSFINKNFKAGSIKKYLQTLIGIFLVVFMYVLLEIIFNPSFIEGDGTFFGTFYVFIFIVLIGSIFFIVLYTLFSPTFWGWLFKKLKKKSN